MPPLPLVSVTSFGGTIGAFLVYPQITVTLIALLMVAIWYGLGGQMWFSRTEARTLPLSKKRNSLKAQTRKTAI